MAYQPVTSLQFLKGMDATVSPTLLDYNSGVLCMLDNCNVTYEPGAILKRPGYEIIGSALEASKPITGMFNFRQSATVQKMLATVNNSGDTATQLFYSTGGAWTEITDAETAWSGYEDTKVEMESFIGYTFFVGYDATDNVWLPLRTLTGTTLGTTNTTSMPQGKYIIRYRDRLYVLNCYLSATAYPYRTYFSSVPSAGTISWTTASDFIDTDYSEEITGAGSNWDRLVIFTEYSAYMYDQTQQKKVWDVGCSNHRTIKNSGKYMLWANRDGVWWSTGGFPENISGGVLNFIRTADMRNAFAEVVDEEYHLYVGNVTVAGVSYSNTALIFHIPTGTWRIHEYYNAMSVFARFYSSGKNFLYMGGNATGSVYRLGKYTDATLLTSDNTQPIQSWWQTGAWSMGEAWNEKEYLKLITFSNRAQGQKLKVRVVDNNTMAITPFDDIGECTKVINEFSLESMKGNFLQIEGTENGSLPYWSLWGFTLFANQSRMTKI